MPSLRLIVASGTGQRRLLEETVAEYESKGYVLGGRQEGGEWVPLLSENMSGGLFDENRLIIVDSAALMGPMPEQLSSMIEEDSPVIIVLVYDSDPSKLIPKDALKKCAILKPVEFPRWPRERQQWVSNLAREMGVKMDGGAISLIVELIEDPEEIRGQMKSLSVMKRDAAITAGDVDAMCLDDGSKSLLRLLDGLCNGDRIAVLKNFRSISKNGDLIPLTSALHNRMRLAWYAAANPRESAMFAKSMGPRDYAWRMAGYAAKRYGKDAVSRFVMGLIRINVDEKGGAGAGWNSLEALLIELLERGK